MARRAFIVGLGGAAARPLPVHAQLDRRVVLKSAGSESDPREQTLYRRTLRHEHGRNHEKYSRDTRRSWTSSSRVVLT